MLAAESSLRPALPCHSEHPPLPCHDGHSPLFVMSSITPFCHVERSRDIFAALAACAQGRIHEISPRATLGRDDREDEKALVVMTMV